MTNRLNTGIHLLIAFILLACVFLMSAQASNLLDGQAFVGKNGEKGRALDPDQDEEIVFANGMFTSLSCEPYDFGSSDYSTETVGDSVHFSAVTESPSHGKISWKGVVKGDTAEVEFVWTKQRWYWDTRKEYWFQGVLKEQMEKSLNPE